ncbi:hypothetical protein CLOSYM_03839 [[Clostridium] symbiosum ATCC 14940]|uniref:Uncharacterized protein n=1 Tax=[Clostridium] symbiosum ATCC 14940 TaxID=411472 RepID=A0ABC9TTW7_CLOSY|nr:hypothetical protein CLOSYM_03839 [[Clostridium] symbiosum ATCC 14940]
MHKHPAGSCALRYPAHENASQNITRGRKQVRNLRLQEIE